jgi:hypothetical protein
LLSIARNENPADEASVIYPESAALVGLARVQEHIVAELSRHRPQAVATLEMDATIIESHKKEALPHYKGGRGYQPSLVYWVEQDLIVADQFRDGNVPAGKGPLEVVKQAFAALPASVEHRRFRADSAAYEDTTLKWLADPENRIERFTVSADITPPTQLTNFAGARVSRGWRCGSGHRIGGSGERGPSRAVSGQMFSATSSWRRWSAGHSRSEFASSRLD